MKNRIYEAKTEYMDGVYWIAARNIKEATKLAKTTGEIEDGIACNEKLILKDIGHKTEHSGELNLKQLQEAGYIPYGCSECESKDIEYNDEETAFKCKKCGGITDVPKI